MGACTVLMCSLCVSLMHCSTTLMQIADGFVQVVVVVVGIPYSQ